MEDKRFAVLIDSDNVSAKYLPGILDEMTKYGICTYRRIYGDFTSTQATKWKMGLLENSVTPIQQYSNTVGKNATDSTLIIDAMDILYSGNHEAIEKWRRKQSLALTKQYRPDLFKKLTLDKKDLKLLK